MIRGETTLQALSNAGLTEASMAGVMKALDEITKFNLENKDPKSACQMVCSTRVRKC